MKYYNYDENTTPETVREDYDNAFGDVERAYKTALGDAQGTKFFNIFDSVDYYGSNDALGLSLKELSSAVQDLYTQDDAAKNFATNNLDSLILSALADMEETGQ